MNRQAYSRSERRMERRQVFVLLLLVVATSLVCFAIGVMVGRNSAPQAMVVQEEIPAAPRIPVAAAPQENEAPPGDGKAATAADTSANLTFYDNLPRGDQTPLGSGINLPPAAATPPPASAPEQTASQAPSLPQPAPATAPVSSQPTPTKTPAHVAASGSYVIQVASFGRPDDAGVLQARLAKKGLEAYVQQADLGSKGVWYRVFVGPLASATEAEKVAARLKSEERLSPLVRKR